MINKVKAHIYHLGMGGNRERGTGKGCNCEVNLIYLSVKQHDELDMRRWNKDIEEIKVKLREVNELLYGSHDIHRYAFAIHYGYVEEFKVAREHYHNQICRV